MTIYEIDERITSLADAETGEITDYEALAALQMERETKLENVALWIKNLKAQAEAIHWEIKELTRRKQSAERKAESLKRYLSEALGGERFDTAKCTCSFRRVSRVEISDEAKLTAWAQKTGHESILTYAPPKISKEEIRELLKAGVEIPCAGLVESLSLGVK